MDLFQAINTGKINEVLRQIELNANVSQSLPDGTTPLMAAAAAGQRRIVEILIRANADRRARDQNGQTALLLAARSGKRKVMEYLARDEAVEERVQASKLLLPDPRVPAFLRAAADGRLEEVRRFIKEGVDVDAILPGDGREQTALYFAVAGGHIEVARALLEAGAPMEDTTLVVQDRGYWPPLLLATRHGHLEVVQLLLNSGADVNAVDGIFRPSPNSNGQSALVVAARYQQVEVARILLAAGADSRVVDKNGFSAMDYAARECNQELMRLLRLDDAPAGDVEISALVAAAAKGDIALVRQMIEAGASVNAENRQGITPLMAASTQELFDFLRQSGADVDYRTSDGQTALITAVRGDAPELMRRLLDAGADINVKDQHEATALDYALIGGDPEVINCLRRRKDAIQAPSRLRHAGIQSFDYPHSLMILVSKPLAQVAGQFSLETRAKSWQHDVYGREVTTSMISFLFFQLAGQDWTILWGISAKAIDRGLNERYAKRLSRTLKTKAVVYEHGDQGSYVTYEHYDAGTLVEKKDGYELARKFFEEQGAFVPALEYWWAPGDRPTKQETFRIMFPGYYPEDIAAADIVTVK
jgi:ankyrin repeat protein